MDFRYTLQNELIERCKRNPKYSLRAFARTLAIEPSALSKILKAKRMITPTMLSRLGIKLGLGPKEIELYKKRLGIKKMKSSVRTEKEYKQLTVDTFHIISDWYHYAILELTTVKDFVPSPPWISKALGLTVSEVNIAVDRLKRLEFLQVEEDGSWKDCSGEITTVGNDFTAAAFRKLQSQVLTMGQAALEEVPLETRDQTSMTMAIDTQKMPEAKKLIQDFRRELCAFLQATSERDEVYQLGISLYPLTKPRKGKGTSPKGA